MENWNEKQTVKKGDIGEKIVNQYLESKGFIIYQPITDKAHAFDKIAIKDKIHMIICEVKTKAKRNYKPDTGIDYRHYLEYKALSEKYNLPVHLFFVDEELKQIYGGRLKDLELPNAYEYNTQYLSYPKVEKTKQDKTIIYFYQPTMKVIHNLTDEEAAEIKSYNTRNYQYSNQNTLL